MTKRPVKKAILDLFADDGTVCTAYEDVPGLKEGKLNDPTDYQIYESEAYGWEQDEEKDMQNERQAVLEVLGWLWRHGYTSAEWATDELSGSGKPEWAKKHKYEWGESDERRQTCTKRVLVDRPKVLNGVKVCGAQRP